MYMLLRNETCTKFTNTYKYIPVHIPSVLCTSVWLTSAVRDSTVHAWTMVHCPWTMVWTMDNGMDYGQWYNR